jgi:hypothetical protein
MSRNLNGVVKNAMKRANRESAGCVSAESRATVAAASHAVAANRSGLHSLTAAAS